MKFVPARGKRAFASAAALAVLLGTTSCAAINEQATTKEYSPSDGVVADIGDAKLRNIAFIADDKDAEARVIGVVGNETSQQLSVTLKVDSGEVSAQVPANQATNLEDEELTVPSSGEPGSLIPVKVTVNGTTEDLNVPVLSSALEEYADLVPGERPTDIVDHLEHDHAPSNPPTN
ncbi:hypothetical protein [Micrococcoides hystricis]|uniref:DNA modification methylase n=1 Tax=Micrococcoides hystricis TaxID=1572761 RepID=A0ABV6PAY4_9MICC